MSLGKQTLPRAARRPSRSIRDEERLVVDEHDYYDYDIDYDAENFEGVHWRMANNPFRLVPAWLPVGREEEYELERAIWALSGEQLCPLFGMPADACSFLFGFLLTLLRIHHDGYCLPQPPYPAACWHSSQR